MDEWRRSVINLPPAPTSRPSTPQQINPLPPLSPLLAHPRRHVWETSQGRWRSVAIDAYATRPRAFNNAPTTDHSKPTTTTTPPPRHHYNLQETPIHLHYITNQTGHSSRARIAQSYVCNMCVHMIMPYTVLHQIELIPYDVTKFWTQKEIASLVQHTEAKIYEKRTFYLSIYLSVFRYTAQNLAGAPGQAVG